VGNVWEWDLRWMRPLSARESDLLNELLVVVNRHFRSDREDWWSWTHSSDGRYSVKLAYSLILSSLSSNRAPKGDVLEATTRVWKSCAPSKVVVFSW